MFRQKPKWLLVISAAALVLEVLVPFVPSQVAAANSLSNSYIRLDRMVASTATTVRVYFKTSATNGTENKLVVTFDKTATNFTVATSSQTIATAACATDTGATALPTTTPTITGDNTAKTITITGVNDLSVSTQYCVDFTLATAVTTPVAGQYTGNITTQDSGSTAIDTIDVAERVVANDQITVNASVPPTFNMTFGANADTIPTINSGTDSASTGVGVTFATNASNGWTGWLKSQNSGLKSAVAGNYTINSQSAGSVHNVGGAGANSDDYGVSAAVTTDSGNGVPSINASYNGNGTTTAGGVDGTYRKFASSTGTASGDVITLKEIAAVGGETPAANDYTDKLTVIGAGTF